MATSDEHKRAETGLRIAQLKFRQALKRGDYSRYPPLHSVPVESSTRFCDDIDAVLRQNTTENVQTCKQWIMEHIAPAMIRFEVLGEYLVALSKSIVVEQPAKSAKAARNRLDIIRVVSDVLHADKFHRKDGVASADVAVVLNPHIEELVELAARAAPGKDSVAEKKLKAALNLWAASGCISADDFDSIHERVDEGLAVAQGATPQRKRTYALPDCFGDRSVPWYELPASYMMEPLVQHPGRPIPAKAIIASRFDQKKPSERVRKLLENYFDNIDLKYLPTGDNPSGETKKYKLWLDSMGQLVKHNKQTEETTTVYNGYGWSPKFCEEMQTGGIPDRIMELRGDYQEKVDRELKRKYNQSALPGDDDPVPLSPRHRYSYSSNSDSRSRSRSRSRSPSHSRSGSTSYGRQYRDDRPRSRDHDSDRYEDRSCRSSYDDGRKYSNFPANFDRPRSRNNDNDSYKDGQRRSSRDEHINFPASFDRKRPHNRQSRWSDNQNNHLNTSRNDFARRRQQHNYNAPNASPAQGVPPQLSQQPHTMSGSVGQFSGYSMTGGPPPPPLQHFHGGGNRAPPPPPPPNFQGPYHGANSNAGGFQNNAYQFANNASPYQNPSTGYGAYQGNFRGGRANNFQGRGGSRGGFQGQGRGGRGRGQSRGHGRY